VDKLLAKKPSDRFQTAAEVAELLAAKYACIQPPSEAAAEACPLKLSASKFVGRRRRPRLVLAGLMIIPFLLGGMLGGFAAWEFAPDQIKEVPVEVVKTIAVPAAPDFPTGPAELNILRGNNGAVWSLATSGDGKLAALGLESGEIAIFDY